MTTYDCKEERHGDCREYGLDGSLCDCHCHQTPPELQSDEAFEQWLKDHPLDPITQENVQASVQRLAKRLRAKPGPTLDL
jgi:hypothetical protein